MRDQLRDLGFTSEGVRALIGEDAFAALGRGNRAPAREALDRLPMGPLADLVRLLLLGEDLPAERVHQAVDPALISRTPHSARAAWQVAPYGDLLVVSDFPSVPLPDDHVTGVGGASVTLATITPRSPVSRTLDLGTGSGIQAVLAAPHSEHVVATEISDRALRAARLTAALNGAVVDFRRGSLFEPVRGERFDLIVANPPFVISPGARHTYREAEQPADSLGGAVLKGCAEHLAPGGVAVVLANWLHVRGESWQQRLAAWAPADCEVWAVQREYLPAAEYVELWLRDSGELATASSGARYQEWYRYLRDLDADGVGFGWIVLRRRAPGWFVAEDLADSERLPDGSEVVQQLDRLALLESLGAAEMLRQAFDWTPGAEIHVSWKAGSGQPTGMIATGSWRPAVEVDRLLLDVVGRPEPIARQVANDDETVRALMGLRQLMAAGLVDTMG